MMQSIFQRSPSWFMRALVLLLTISIGACSTITSTVGGWFDDSKTKPVELTDIKTTLPVRQLWSVKIGSAEKFFFTPAVIENQAYVAAADGDLAKIELATGKQIWSSKTGQELSAGVGSDGKLVVVVSNRGDILAFDANGKPLWKTATNGEIVSPPAVGAGTVVVRTTDSRILAFDGETGRRKWVYQRPSQSLVLRIASGLLIHEDLVYAGMPGGRLVALTLSNGSLRWDSSVAVPKGATDLERVTDVVGKPVMYGAVICTAAYQGRITCFDAVGGYTIWARDVSSSTGLDIDARYVFATDEKSVLQGMNSSNGVAVWRNDKLLYRAVSAPASIGRAVVVGDYKGILHWLAREDGSFMARVNTDGTPLTAQPIVFSNGTTPALLVQTQGGYLYAFASD